jgi:hypothetical protein
MDRNVWLSFMEAYQELGYCPGGAGQAHLLSFSLIRNSKRIERTTHTGQPNG